MPTNYSPGYSTSHISFVLKFMKKATHTRGFVMLAGFLPWEASITYRLLRAAIKADGVRLGCDPVQGAFGLFRVARIALRACAQASARRQVEPRAGDTVPSQRCAPRSCTSGRSRGGRRRGPRRRRREGSAQSGRRDSWTVCGASLCDRATVVVPMSGCGEGARLFVA